MSAQDKILSFGSPETSTCIAQSELLANVRELYKSLAPTLRRQIYQQSQSQSAAATAAVTEKQPRRSRSCPAVERHHGRRGTVAREPRSLRARRARSMASLRVMEAGGKTGGGGGAGRGVDVDVRPHAPAVV
ncbi:hypothetical protein HK104_010131, partial [Borealophlyctis nickersoniae]